MPDTACCFTHSKSCNPCSRPLGRHHSSTEQAEGVTASLPHLSHSSPHSLSSKHTGLFAVLKRATNLSPGLCTHLPYPRGLHSSLLTSFGSLLKNHLIGPAFSSHLLSPPSPPAHSHHHLTDCILLIHLFCLPAPQGQGSVSVLFTTMPSEPATVPGTWCLFSEFVLNEGAEMEAGGSSATCPGSPAGTYQTLDSNLGRPALGSSPLLLLPRGTALCRLRNASRLARGAQARCSPLRAH